MERNTVMFFNSKPDYIFFVRRGSLELASADASIHIDIPESVIRNLEVLKPEQFSEALSNLLKSNDIHNKNIAIILDESVVFEKTISKKPSSQDIRKLKDEFVETLPFDDNHCAAIYTLIDSTPVIIGTNSQIYECISQAIKLQRNKVSAVIPAAVYKIAKNDKLTKNTSATIFNNFIKLAKNNFLNT